MDSSISAGQPAAGAEEPADIATSSDAYASRFSGKTGAWMLAVQRDITIELLASLPGRRILDVGGGHGQLALPLAEQGYEVTVLGSVPSCAHRLRAGLESGRCRFETGDTHALAYPDKSFDAVLSFRLVTHSERWPDLIRECCRVARDCVVVDYPTSQSLNAIAPALFGAKKKIERDTRTWALFRHVQIREAFEACGFRICERRPQFFLPMVLHRALRCRSLSAALEAACRAVGLTQRWGSPVILKAVPITGATAGQKRQES